MTRTEIIFNYNRAMKEAERLENLAKKLNRIADRDMESAIGTLKNAWNSDYSGQYYKKAYTVEESIKKSAANLSAIANSIRKIAEITKNSELRALETAKNRSYKK